MYGEKPCPGKYHEGIKYIRQDQDYCDYCKQKMEEKKGENIVNVRDGIVEVCGASVVIWGVCKTAKSIYKYFKNKKKK